MNLAADTDHLDFLEFSSISLTLNSCNSGERKKAWISLDIQESPNFVFLYLFSDLMDLSQVIISVASNVNLMSYVFVVPYHDLALALFFLLFYSG